MGSALSVAAMLIALDYIKHPLPPAIPSTDNMQSGECQSTNPCGLVFDTSKDASSQRKKQEKCSSKKSNPCGLVL